MVGNPGIRGFGTARHRRLGFRRQLLGIGPGEDGALASAVGLGARSRGVFYRWGWKTWSMLFKALSRL